MAVDLSDVDYLTGRIAALELLMTGLLASAAGGADDPEAMLQAMKNAVMSSGQNLSRGISEKDDAVWAATVNSLELRFRDALVRVRRA